MRILRLGPELTRLQSIQRFRQQVRPHGRQPILQLRGRFLRSYLQRFLQKQVPGIHASVDSHGGDAGAGFAADNRPGNRVRRRGSAAEARHAH